ncbi:hypothetical protein HC725_02620 [Vibrio sp. S17_S38]|uniref:hypothetical protein n=1 Tax=Vibrio sp. S17_S38 TaxID=2720229 RepID=UPI001680853F|nr:hypothetical protein [Vibrio sp. S17_S38]MBD1572175.1 hypothetical protein [Vibrio sp. S17_S38]
MKCKSIVLIFSVVFLLPFNVYSWGSLQSEKVDGFSRYCHYSDGGVETVKSIDLCPVDNQSTAKHSGSPTINIKKSNNGFGSLTSEKTSGFNRYCTYSNGSVLTVSNTDLCPLTGK